MVEAKEGEAMKKERDTVILSLRIPKDLLAKVNDKVARSDYRSRNAWLLSVIKEGLRNHHKAKK